MAYKVIIKKYPKYKSRQVFNNMVMYNIRDKGCVNRFVKESTFDSNFSYTVEVYEGGELIYKN